MTYTLTVLSNGREIKWETSHAQTAHKWFRLTVQHGRTIDTGAHVSLVSLRRDGIEIKVGSIS